MPRHGTAGVLAALAPLGTDKHKPYLETAPYLIAVFAQRYGRRADGTRQTHNSVMESVGIAAGFSLAARHHSGLATLAHTPNPMGFLNEILERAVSERAIMLVVTAFRLRTLSCRTSRERLSRISRRSLLVLHLGAAPRMPRYGGKSARTVSGASAIGVQGAVSISTPNPSATRFTNAK